MTNKDINKEYFEWLCDIACGNRYSKFISYKKLLRHLHNVEFTYSIDRDENRAEDGIDLRYRFLQANHYEEYYLRYMDGPCSIFEMMLALAIRCEENIMDNPNIGNRVGQWFWGMVNTLGLGSMTDERFDIEYVGYVIERFLDREYMPNGKGGLFMVRNCDSDLRNVEIWYQLCWYLDSINDVDC